MAAKPKVYNPKDETFEDAGVRPDGWWGVGSEDDGVLAYFFSEDAARRYAESVYTTPPKLTKEQISHISPGVLGRVALERRIVWGLLCHLEKLGFKPLAVDGTRTPTVFEAFEEIMAVDEARPSFKKDGHGTHRVLIVLGNDGVDCISDWGYSPDDEDGFNKAMEAFDPEEYV